MQDKNVTKLTDQDAALLEQGASMLEGLESDERNRGNCSTAEGAACSAHAVRRLASALLAHERSPSQCLHQIQEPAAEQPPASGQSRFHGQEWTPCAVEHVAMVLATPHEWQGYEVRYLYAAPAEGSVSNATFQAAPAAVAMPDDRAAFERELIDNHHYVPSDFSFKDGIFGGDDDYIQFGWDVWQARAALAATPAMAINPEECAQEVFKNGASVGLFDIPKETANAICAGISLATGARVDWHYIAGRVHIKALAATPAADAPAVSKWIDDPHDIEQGQMLNPEWVKAQKPVAAPVVPNGWVPCVVTYEGQHPEEVAYGPQIMMDRLKKWLESYFELKAAAPVVLPEPDGFLESHPFGSIYHRGKPSQIQMICGACPPMYEAGTVRALLATATGLPAQAVPAKLITAINTVYGGNEWQGDALVTDLLEPACRAIANLSPQAQADARDADDAALIEWLSGQYLAADFHWGDPKTSVLVIEIPPTASVCGDFRTDVRAAIAIAAAKGE